MAEVVFHIPIQDGWHGESWLLETVFDLDFLPLEGDVFHPLKNDGESGLTMEVYRRWWEETGKVSIQTHTYVIDPPQDLAGHFIKTYRQWNSGTDGDLVGTLLENGWWPYGRKVEPKPKADSPNLQIALQQMEALLREQWVTPAELMDYLRGRRS